MRVHSCSLRKSCKEREQDSGWSTKLNKEGSKVWMGYKIALQKADAGEGQRISGEGHASSLGGEMSDVPRAVSVSGGRPAP